MSRILYSMGRDDVLPRRFFGHVSPRFGTPVGNIVVTSLIALSAVFYSDDLLGAASLNSFGAVTGFVVVNYAAINHYFVRERRRSGTDLLRFLVLPGLGMLVTTVLWVGIDNRAKLLGLAWLGLGAVYIGFTSRGFRRPPAPLELEEAPPFRETLPSGGGRSE